MLASETDEYGYGQTASLCQPVQSCGYLLGPEGEQELLVLVRRQDAHERADLEGAVRVWVELDLGRRRGLDGGHGSQVGLHDLPVEGQLHVTSGWRSAREGERRKERCCERLIFWFWMSSQSSNEAHELFRMNTFFSRPA